MNLGKNLSYLVSLSWKITIEITQNMSKKLWFTIFFVKHCNHNSGNSGDNFSFDLADGHQVGRDLLKLEYFFNRLRLLEKLNVKILLHYLARSSVDSSDGTFSWKYHQSRSTEDCTIHRYKNECTLAAILNSLNRQLQKYIAVSSVGFSIHRTRAIQFVYFSLRFRV